MQVCRYIQLLHDCLETRNITMTGLSRGTFNGTLCSCVAPVAIPLWLAQSLSALRTSNSHREVSVLEGDTNFCRNMFSLSPIIFVPYCIRLYSPVFLCG
jgi:hypothetical protein